MFDTVLFRHSNTVDVVRTHQWERYIYLRLLTVRLLV